MNEQIENLYKSHQLSKQVIDNVINPLEIIELFEKNGLKYALIGGHMLAYYTNNPRATVDVDFIIAGGDFKKALKIISNHYSQLLRNDKTHHVTFDTIHGKNFDPERIDLIPDDFPLFKKVLKSLSLTKLKIKIPDIEAAITLKFAASISPNRSESDKLIDQSDLIDLVNISHQLNENKLISLADSIYTGGGSELMQLISDIKKGEPISL
ncbi:MAG: hypothetical protein L3J83_01695 [Proteobacteria bacterium]|nr:hypothetical protein [Pseudomonadota bacterium]